DFSEKTENACAAVDEQNDQESQRSRVSRGPAVGSNRQAESEQRACRQLNTPRVEAFEPEGRDPQQEQRKLMGKPGLAPACDFTQRRKQQQDRGGTNSSL